MARIDSVNKVFDPQEAEPRLYNEWKDKGYFKPDSNPEKEAFSIVMPPPNITGQLHMGHALDNTLQDILVRYKRMRGYSTLWLPGTDHAGDGGLADSAFAGRDGDDVGNHTPSPFGYSLYLRGRVGAGEFLVDGDFGVGVDISLDGRFCGSEE